MSIHQHFLTHNYSAPGVSKIPHKTKSRRRNRKSRLIPGVLGVSYCPVSFPGAQRFRSFKDTSISNRRGETSFSLELGALYDIYTPQTRPQSFRIASFSTSLDAGSSIISGPELSLLFDHITILLFSPA